MEFAQVFGPENISIAWRRHWPLSIAADWPSEESNERMNFPDVFGERPQATRLQFVLEALAGWWVLALLTFTGYILHFDASSVGFLFLLTVVCTAIVCGFWQASVVSLAACLCLDYYFYPPLLHLTMNDVHDWLALGAFEASALLVSRVSAREHIHSSEARMQRAGMEQLYELSRSTLLINMHQPAGPQLVRLVERIFAADAVAIFDAVNGTTDRTGCWRDDERDLAKECYLLQADGEDRMSKTRRRLLWSGSECIGALVIRGEIGLLAVDALASLTAVTLDRAETFQKESRVEAAHQGEKLRTAVLDSLAHAVKTPLTAIHTANAGLSEVGVLNPAQTELVSLIESESRELTELTNRLLQTAKLESQEFSIGTDEIALGDLVHSAINDQRQRMNGHRVDVAISDPRLKVTGDRDLLAMALVQYLDNASKYSFPGTTIKVSAWESHAEIIISVHNFGPLIPITEREAVFQRFFRGESTLNLASGTGIGLSTVKMAAEAHKGHVWVISGPDEGTTFYLSLPQKPGGRS